MDEINKTQIQGPVTYLEVFDMPTSLHFYRDLIGFTVLQTSGDGDDVDWVMLQLNESTLMLNTAYDREERPDQPDPVRTRGHADVILYFGYPDIDAFYNYFSARGIDLDPDGYRLCFHWPVE